MKSRRGPKSKKWLAFAALALLAGNSAVGAQELGHGKAARPSRRAAQVSSGIATLFGSEPFSSGADTRTAAGPTGRQVIVRMPMHSGYASRSASPEFHQIEEVKQEPRSLSIPPAEHDAALSFPNERERYWQPRATSPIPQETRSGMYPGSRLRGPFEQTYPRPFPGGGQP